MASIVGAIPGLVSDLAKSVDIQVPSFERPFGLHLFPLFDVFFKRAAGYSAREFEFKYGETPIGTMKEAGALIITYYIVILGGREIMRNFNAFKFQRLFQIHNFLLTMISGGLLALFIEELAPILRNRGLLYAICDYNGGWTPTLVALYYVSIREEESHVRRTRH